MRVSKMHWRVSPFNDQLLYAKQTTFFTRLHIYTQIGTTCGRVGIDARSSSSSISLRCSLQRVRFDLFCLFYCDLIWSVLLNSRDAEAADERARQRDKRVPLPPLPVRWLCWLVCRFVRFCWRVWNIVAVDCRICSANATCITLIRHWQSRTFCFFFSHSS